MKITLITSSKNRHNYLINLLSKFCDELYVIQEAALTSKIIPSRYPTSSVMKNYFEKVNNAQTKFFANSNLSTLSKNTRVMPITFGSINEHSLAFLDVCLKSDIYIVFGGSYIKGDLADFLIEKKTINIHMGVSPYYRGSDCNFWALYDNNPHLVGATIHNLSKGLDNGPILYHAMSNIKANPFEYTMSTVQSAFQSMAKRIKDKTIFEIEPIKQDKLKEIRFSKKNDFSEKIINEFFTKKIDLKSKVFDNSLLKDPFFLDV